MTDQEKILETAQAIVRQSGLPLKIKTVEPGREEVKIFFTAEKRLKLRELVQELELQLRQPVKMERFKKAESVKIGGVDIFGKYSCCAPFLRHCPFAGKNGCGCGYGFNKVSRCQSVKVSKPPKPSKPPETPKQEKKRKVVRRVVLKG